MNERRHVWHDSDAPPPEILSGNGVPAAKSGPKQPSRRARTTLWVLLWVVIGSVLLAGLAFFGAVVVSAFMDGFDDPVIVAPLKVHEEAGVRGLAATVAEHGRTGDYQGIAELGDGSSSMDTSRLTSDADQSFGGFPLSKWELDVDGVRLLVDRRTEERIVMFRLVLHGSDGTQRSTTPFYARQVDESWRLTGISGRDLEEILY